MQDLERLLEIQKQEQAKKQKIEGIFLAKLMKVLCSLLILLGMFKVSGQPKTIFVQKGDYMTHVTYYPTMNKKNNDYIEQVVIPQVVENSRIEYEKAVEKNRLEEEERKTRFSQEFQRNLKEGKGFLSMVMFDLSKNRPESTHICSPYNPNCLGNKSCKK